MRALYLVAFLGLFSLPLHAASIYDLVDANSDGVFGKTYRTSQANETSFQQSNRASNRKNSLLAPLEMNFRWFLSDFKQRIARNRMRFLTLSSAGQGLHTMPNNATALARPKSSVIFDSPFNVQNVHRCTPLSEVNTLHHKNLMVEYHGYGGAVLGFTIPVTINIFRLQGGDDDHNH